MGLGDHTLSIDENEVLWAWGYNGNGRLGDGTTTQKTSQVKIMEDVKQVSAGNSHTLAIKNDNSLWAWGINLNGRLGDGTTAQKTSPVKIMEDVKQVSAGG